MRKVWLHIALLVAATVVSHDIYMATTGHAVIAAQDVESAGRGDSHQGHRHHAAAAARDDDRPAPAGMPAHCDSLRVAAPLNRDMSPLFDTVPTALLPDPAILMRFTSASRDIVETPLPHPPDLDRAFYQVYRL